MIVGTFLVIGGAPGIDKWRPGMLLNTPQCPGWPHREQSDLDISRAAAEEIQACKIRVPRSGGLEPNVCGGEAGKSAAEAVTPAQAPCPKSDGVIPTPLL